MFDQCEGQQIRKTDIEYRNSTAPTHDSVVLLCLKEQMCPHLPSLTALSSNQDEACSPSSSRFQPIHLLLRPCTITFGWTPSIAMASLPIRRHSWDQEESSSFEDSSGHLRHQALPWSHQRGAGEDPQEAGCDDEAKDPARARPHHRQGW